MWRGRPYNFTAYIGRHFAWRRLCMGMSNTCDMNLANIYEYECFHKHTKVHRFNDLTLPVTFKPHSRLLTRSVTAVRPCYRQSGKPSGCSNCMGIPERTHFPLSAPGTSMARHGLEGSPNNNRPISPKWNETHYPFWLGLMFFARFVSKKRARCMGNIFFASENFGSNFSRN